MSFGTRAAVQVVLESRTGQWCTPAWIAGRVVMPIHQVLFACEELVLAGQAMFEMADPPRFGVDVTAEYPAINDVRADWPGHPGTLIRDGGHDD